MQKEVFILLLSSLDIKLQVGTGLPMLRQKRVCTAVYSSERVELKVEHTNSLMPSNQH